MTWTRSAGRVAFDHGFIGAVVGLVVSLILFVALMGAAIRIDRNGTDTRMGCTCLLRMAALLVLTFGLGIGYMISRSMGGG